MARLVIDKAASKDLLGLPRRDRDRIEQRIEAYAADPASRFHDIAKIVGADTLFRLRVGDWRVILNFDNDTVSVLRVRHRREAYR
jgi:mRNA interferase RelE/StbE